MECRGIIHVVREGDTLYTLSRKYHVPLPQVMYANPFVDIYNLQIGDELCIPVSLRDETQREKMQGERVGSQGFVGTDARE